MIGRYADAMVAVGLVDHRASGRSSGAVVALGFDYPDAAWKFVASAARVGPDADRRQLSVERRSDG
jgi:hypothetical protein